MAATSVFGSRADEKAASKAQVYNLHLLTGNRPDCTDFESFVASFTRAWVTSEEKAVREKIDRREMV
jgi:hypothetical protein